MAIKPREGSPRCRIGIVIPACNEQLAVSRIVKRCIDSAARLGEVRVCVVDNDSDDLTAAVARKAGAEVVFESPRGYGRACLKGLAMLAKWPDILVFVDADGSSRPEEMVALIEPIQQQRADLVIGRRPADAPMTPPQRWGTRLAAQLIRLRWGRKFADIGPFRAIRRESLESLGMQDRTWGWTVEMQILALLNNLSVLEVPVSWEERIAGKSKISGSVVGVVRAGGRILWTLLKYSLRSPPVPAHPPDA